jgi:hypothetical protein
MRKLKSFIEIFSLNTIGSKKNRSISLPRGGSRGPGTRNGLGKLKVAGDKKKKGD